MNETHLFFLGAKVVAPMVFERETVAAFFSSLERLSRPVRHVTPFPFYFSLALFSNYTLILEISPIHSPILNNCALNAAELLISCH